MTFPAMDMDNDVRVNVVGKKADGNVFLLYTSDNQYGQLWCTGTVCRLSAADEKGQKMRLERNFDPPNMSTISE